MVGLDPAIHAATRPYYCKSLQQCLGVDARHKAGHDAEIQTANFRGNYPAFFFALSAIDHSARNAI